MSNNLFTEAFKSFESLTKQNSNFDLDAFAANGKKNVETLQNASEVLVESFQSIAKLQSEIVKTNIENSVNLFKEISSSKNPQENSQKQADFAKSSFEQATSNIKEISKIATQANKKAGEIINKQASENISNISAATNNTNSAKKSTTKKSAA